LLELSFLTIYRASHLNTTSVIIKIFLSGKITEDILSSSDSKPI